MSTHKLLPVVSLAAMLAISSLALAPSAVARDKAVTQTAAIQAQKTPAAAIEMLKRDLPAQVTETATGQYPFAVVLGRIDSRVPPELVFDQGIGDIFSPRIAGNFVNIDILGSMEFATAVAGSKAIVVLGHTECGAVKGACDNVELGNLTQTLSNISPAVYSVKNIAGERSSKNAAFVDAVAHSNVRLTVDNIIERSAVIRDLVEKGELMVVGAMHDVATGEVTFLE
jgi:carbonic anhydrase